jgi:hypothetical protein
MFRSLLLGSLRTFLLSRLANGTPAKSLLPLSVGGEGDSNGSLKNSARWNHLCSRNSLSCEKLSATKPSTSFSPIATHKVVSPTPRACWKRQEALGPTQC